MATGMRRILAALAGATMLVTAPAQAVTFNLIDTGGTAIGTQARQGFDAAAYYWSSVLTNSVTINLEIGFRTLGTGILGSTNSTRSVNFNNAVYDALAANATSALDQQALASRQTLGTSIYGNGLNALTMTTNALNSTRTGYLDTATRVDNDKSINNVAVAVNTSVDKALGITVDANNRAINYALRDGAITFSSAFAFDFDARDGIDAASFDFVGVAIHEIGHALGFVSGVDTYDAYTAPGSTSLLAAGALEGSVVGSVLDLYRYTAPGVLDWSTQGTPYFSVDGGATQLFDNSLFSTGTLNGDGRQASHWKDSVAGVPQLGILDPTSGRGQMQEVTALDLAAYDAIGWTIAPDVVGNVGYRISTATIFTDFAGAIPEPSSWALMILGFGMVGSVMRRPNRFRKTALI